MYPPSRPPTRSDGTAALTEDSAGEPQLVGFAGASRSCSQPGRKAEPEAPARCRSNSAADSLDVFQQRSIFISPRRSSSGYFSLESNSLPGTLLSPWPITADRGTQTPSPSGRVIEHALLRMDTAQSRGGAGTQRLHEIARGSPSTRQRNAARDMQEKEFGQDLRRFGDNFNQLILSRRGHVFIHPHQLPLVHQGPTVLLCVGLLLLVIGRLIYSQHSPDSSQV